MRVKIQGREGRTYSTAATHEEAADIMSSTAWSIADMIRKGTLPVQAIPYGLTRTCTRIPTVPLCEALGLPFALVDDGTDQDTAR